MSCSWAMLCRGSKFSMLLPSPFTPCAPPSCIQVHKLQHQWPRNWIVASRQRLQVVCMAHPRRVARVSSQIQREIGDMFVSDPVIQAAICPERKGGGDTLSAVASITNTYVSNDLQVVKVFVSVYSDDYGKRVAMQNLARLEPYVRRLIGQRVRLRRTPEVRYVYDDSEEEADLVMRVLGRDEVERYRNEIESDLVPGRGSVAGAAVEEDGEEEEDGFDNDEDEEFDEDEDMFDDPDEMPQEYPNPFGDLFGDVRGNALVGQPRRRGDRGRGGRGKKGPRGNAADDNEKEGLMQEGQRRGDMETSQLTEVQ
ncbi:hypothetical protein VaNZ11_003209 [Volvox africanus]|uniref:Ribosome-binding factor A n=1 Tax=Volvox africanus TaxID=51714 RepID=A0ABQ5RTQ9_9CHLO|nr:hypothetical protein VaNZ11_003209 [Volvox africanus]